MSPAGPVRIGLDIGGTSTTAIALVGEGVVGTATFPTQPGADEVSQTAIAAIRAALEKAGGAVPVAIGVGVPGQVVRATGVVRNAVNLGVVHLALGDVLRSEFSAPVTVDNDVRAASLGAYMLENRTGSLAYLNLGTGVAAGLVVDGTVFDGSAGIAGEIGHMSVDPNGPLCRCGQLGCIEAFCGGASVAARWTGATDMPLVDVFDRAAAGEDAATAERSQFAFGVAAAVRLLVLSLDPEHIVLGGGQARLGARLLSAVGEELDRSAERSPFLRELALHERVSTLALDSIAAPYGAALLTGTHTEGLAPQR